LAIDKHPDRTVHEMIIRTQETGVDLSIQHIDVVMDGVLRKNCRIARALTVFLKVFRQN
jgi:hypothetical protein